MIININIVKQQFWRLVDFVNHTNLFIISTILYDDKEFGVVHEEINLSSPSGIIHG